MAVAFHFIAERTDHLAVAKVAAFTHVDVTARKLQRRVGAHALHFLDGVFEIEERCDFNDAADRDHGERCDQQQRCVFSSLEWFFSIDINHTLLIRQAAWLHR